MKARYWMVHTAVLALVTSAALPSGQTGAIEVKSICKISERVKQVDLVDKNMRIRTGATNLMVEVGLAVTENVCKIQEHVGDKSVEKELTLWCYELSSKHDGVPYARAMWTFRPVKGFRVFSDINGRNYSAWVDGTVVRIEDVSESRGAPEALRCYMSNSGVYTVPVTRLIGREPFRGLNAIHSDIEIVSLSVSETGAMQLKIRAPKTAEEFELVFDGEAWKLRTK